MGQLAHQQDGIPHPGGGPELEVIDGGGSHLPPAVAPGGDSGHHIHPFQQPAPKKPLAAIDVLVHDNLYLGGAGFRHPSGWFHGLFLLHHSAATAVAVWMAWAWAVCWAFQKSW